MEWDDPHFKPYRNAFPGSVNTTPEDLRAHVEDLTKRDVKVAYHKHLQGYLWENGYRTGAYSTPLFPDVAPALEQWKQEGYQLAIYSSGSVFAQKLLFAHVQVNNPAMGEKRKRSDPVDRLDDPAVAPPAKRPATEHEANVETSRSSSDEKDNIKDVDDRLGSKEEDANSPSRRTEDLQYLIEAWFDTTNAGSKTESSSYEQIAHELRVSYQLRARCEDRWRCSWPLRPSIDIANSRSDADFRCVVLERQCQRSRCSCNGWNEIHHRR